MINVFTNTKIMEGKLSKNFYFRSV